MRFAIFTGMVAALAVVPSSAHATGYRQLELKTEQGRSTYRSARHARKSISPSDICRLVEQAEQAVALRQPRVRLTAAFKAKALISDAVALAGGDLEPALRGRAVAAGFPLGVVVAHAALCDDGQRRRKEPRCD